MKKTIEVLILVLVFPVLSFSQKKNFQGEITFVQKLHSKIPKVSDKKMQNYFGDTDVVLIKNGNYKHTYLNSAGIEEVIYISSLNKWFYKLKNVDTLYFKDASIDTSKVISLTKDSLTKNILGFQCKSLTIQTAATKLQFFYADSLYINPENFTQHVFGHYNLYAKESESIYLNSITETPYLKSELLAVKVLNKEINDDEFILPDLPQIHD